MSEKEYAAESEGKPVEEQETDDGSIEGTDDTDDETEDDVEDEDAGE